jgi:hypothetical protein
MPAELPHACHNCVSLGDWYADGAHCWCRRHRLTVATPATGCAYWMPAKNAHVIEVPVHQTLLSSDFERVKGT